MRVYQSARIWAPWNLTMDEDSCLGDEVDCYCVAPVHLHRGAVVSQYASLCTATHDYTTRSNDLCVAPVTIESDAWVTARAFVGPGVVVGAGAVVGACAVVMRDVAPWTVVAGNPARPIKKRQPFVDAPHVLYPTPDGE